MLIVDEATVKQSITPEECINVVEDGFRMLARGEIAFSYGNMTYHHGTAGIHLYAAAVPTYGVGAKILHTHEDNPEKGKPYIYATVVLLDSDSGKPIALLNGGYLTALRTGAAAALSTRYLARSNSEILGILGTGLQGRTHLLCQTNVHPFKKVLVWDSVLKQSNDYKAEMSLKVDIPIHIASSAEAVCYESDVISCTSRAKTPLFPKEVIRAGTHIIVTGAMGTAGSEIPIELLERGSLFVDSADEFNKLWTENDAPEGVAELGKIILDQRKGRQSSDEVTIFKPVGMAFEDIVCARVVVDRIQRDKITQVQSW